MAKSYSQLEKLKTPEQPEAHALVGRLGIYLRLYPSGDHQWYWRGTLDRPIWVHLGPKLSAGWTLKALQDEAIRLRQLVDQGIDPNAPLAEVKPKDTTPTLDEAWEMFKAQYLVPLRSTAYLDGMEKLWCLHIRPRFGSMPIDTVTTATALEVVRPLLQDKKFTTANHLRSLLSKLYNWSVGRWPNVVQAVNWTKAVTKAEVHPDERVLTKRELVALGKGFLNSRAKHKLAALWLLLTGSRSGVLKVWDPTWIEGQIVVIPKGVQGVKKARAIVMPKSAASLVRKMTLPLTTSGLRHALDDVVSHAGITGGSISPHTLRKTWSSIGADLGEPEPVIDALQNHKGSAIKQAYIRRSCEAMLPTAEKIAAHLLQVMGIDVREVGYDPSEDLLVNHKKEGATKSRSRATVARQARRSGPAKAPTLSKSASSEPPVGVKAARMPRKDALTDKPKTKAKAKLFRRRSK
ncbi:tyrosine-type recombinase/integrase [Geothrix paludis]|uniref:tyrosine-type recombinase/integrase n=1 Tax=Geothrix paludis TaxID=2922722 RepID=UPI001FAC94CF|nr:integrase arm-type DNA-binding domain-containing protein [Geothrix paludis]